MPLSWSEIRDNAIVFSKKWESDFNERAEAKSFWDDFFTVFGVARKRRASFEERVHLSGDRHGYIDLLWKGVILIEHKSKGKDLDRAYDQARAYFPGLKDYDLPQYILVSDFENFRLYECGTEERIDFKLKDLHKFVKLFGFMAGYQTKKITAEDPVNFEAAERMAKLHISLTQSGYTGHQLEVYLVRILFCLFAEDTGIFEKRMFQDYLELKTNEDGTDLGIRLEKLFEVLNTPDEKRSPNLDETLKEFCYINGGLFKEKIPSADFNKAMRESLLQCCGVDWSKISPAIFGSLFQNVMDEEARRNLGAHYTSEENILKLIRPLFLEELEAEFQKVKRNSDLLREFQKKLGSLKFLDPACGCGNFLVVTYREIRKLEVKILIELFKKDVEIGARILDLDLVRVNVDQFYGIEIEEFPSKIAEVALWLVDHQMNNLVSEALAQRFTRLPLTTSPNIHYGNSLTTDWQAIVPKKELSYILGNPPFIGSKLMSAGQRKELEDLSTEKGKSVGVLDYVSGWYLKAAQYILGTKIQVGFVSTNSICQGEQVSVLWGILYQKYGVKINFAHQTFKWKNEAKGVAGVYCIIVGFAGFAREKRRLFTYENVSAEPLEVSVANINAYLVDAADILLPSRSTPICDVPELGIGNKPIDDGQYLLSPEEKDALVRKEPKAEQWIRKWLGSNEFLKGKEAWCLWLGDCPPNELRKMPEVMKRVEAVRDFRLKSKSKPTNKLAGTPTRFHVENIPESEYILVPRHSSENRTYIPMAFLPPDVLTGDSCLILSNASLYHFGVLMSRMHMAWVRYTCGRLESRYRYSASIVYNNFPWPEDCSIKAKEKIEKAAQEVVDARKEHPKSSLSDLYDPAAMPPNLFRAHNSLDKAVDAAYGKVFSNESARVSYLFDLYQKLNAPIVSQERPKGRSKKTT